MPETPPKQHAAVQDFCAQTETNAVRKLVPQENNPLNIEARKLLSFWAAKKGVSAPELEYRARVLRDIAVRRGKDGPHAARAHADRARQFMPFAALKGYHELAHEQEFVRQPRQDMTDERARILSERGQSACGPLQGRSIRDRLRRYCKRRFGISLARYREKAHFLRRHPVARTSTMSAEKPSAS